MRVQQLSEADVAYVRHNFRSLQQLCAGRAETPAEVRKLIAGGFLPQPSYVLDDGTEMFPPGYLRLADEAGGPQRLREHFAERYRAAGETSEGFEEEWDGYLSGVYGVCLKDPTPETIVRKTALVESLTTLLDEPQPDDPTWRARLRAEVDELDALEREFSPDYDRGDRFDQPPTRDRLIVAARERYPRAFEREGRSPPPGVGPFMSA
jgi:hypothetical protein